MSSQVKAKFPKYAWTLALVLIAAGVFSWAHLNRAATTVGLGAADNFAILAGSAITNVGTTTVVGNVGLDPLGGTFITGLTCADMTGTIYDNDAGYTGGGGGSTACLSTNPGLLITAKSNLVTAYDNVAGQTPATAIGVELGGTTKTPGIYSSGTFTITGTLTLDAQNNPNAVFIFQAASTLTAADDSVITLINGAQAANVFWQVGVSATLGTNSVFKGNILALTSITLNHGANVEGRLLARNGAVTLDTNIVTKAANLATLRVVKQVVNTGGGSATSSLFNLHVKLAGTEVFGSPQFGTTTPGTLYTLPAGTYTVSEDAHASYTPVFSDDCAAGGSVVLSASSSKLCTVTNNYIPPAPATSTITVIKVVNNVYGGSKVIANFPLFVSGTPVVSGDTNIFATGTYAVTETSDLTAYSRAFSGDCDASGSLTLIAGENAICTITNDDIAPAVVTSSSYTASPSYQTGGTPVAPVPPLLDLVKVPSPLALPGGAGAVTYIYTLRNMGTVPVTGVTLTDDSCGPVTLFSGDVNGDHKLDVPETWTYRCATVLSTTHTNTAVATGWADGLSTADIALATVVVGAPVIPPLIHVTKIPSPLVLGAGAGWVTYTEKVSNPGTVALSDVTLTDSKCAPHYVSGDTNHDSKLDTDETWTYACRTKLTQTTTNTAIASGSANGLTARDFALATVVVSAIVPKLPNTGLPPLGRNERGR